MVEREMEVERAWEIMELKHYHVRRQGKDSIVRRDNKMSKVLDFSWIFKD